MTEDSSSPAQDAQISQHWLATLAQSDPVLETIGPIMQHLLRSRTAGLFTEQIQAQLRGMIAHLAAQLAGDDAQPDLTETLLQDLVANEALLQHCHARVIEWQLMESLKRRGIVDPVLNPLFQKLIALPDPELSALARNTLVKQAHFEREMQLMELPLDELPDALLASILAKVGKTQEGRRVRSDGPKRDQTRVRSLARLVSMLADNSHGAHGAHGVHDVPAIEFCGLSIMINVLMLKTGQSRDLVIRCFTATQAERLALSLRAAGLDKAAIAAQFLHIYRQFELPPDFEQLDQLSPDDAVMLLKGTLP